MAIILFSFIKYHRRKPPLQFCFRPGRDVDVSCSSVLIFTSPMRRGRREGGGKSEEEI
jgi:hypothetical protein